MPAPSSEPLIKITMNFYESDIIHLKAIYGRGWQGQIRDMAHRYVRDYIVAMQIKPTEQYLEEDFDE